MHGGLEPGQAKVPNWRYPEERGMNNATALQICALCCVYERFVIVLVAVKAETTAPWKELSLTSASYRAKPKQAVDINHSQQRCT